MEIDDFFKNIKGLYNNPQGLAAIWLKYPLVTGEGKTCRIAPDMLVRIENNELVDCAPGLPVTHKILGCYGTLINQFEISVYELSTNDLSIIKL